MSKPDSEPDLNPSFEDLKPLDDEVLDQLNEHYEEIVFLEDVSAAINERLQDMADTQQELDTSYTPFPNIPLPQFDLVSFFCNAKVYKGIGV